MIRLMSKKEYVTPRTMLVQTGAEGLICASFAVIAEVDELRNVNAEDGDTYEDFYFEF